MKKQVVAVSAALLLAGSIGTAEAQYGHRGYGHGGYRGPAVSTGYGGGYGGYPYGGYYRRNNNGGAFAAGLVSSLVLGSLLPGLGGLGAAGYGAGAYHPYSYGYEPGYAPMPVVYRPIRQRVIDQPRVHRVHMRARMVPMHRRAVYR